MKTAVFSLLAVLSLFSALADGEIAASVTLRDSSVIKGTVAEATALEGGVVFADDVKIPLPLVREMAADGTNGAQIVTLANGDVFRLAPKTKSLSVTTVLGDLTIPLANIRKVVFSASGSASDGLIYYCTFDFEARPQDPAVLKLLAELSSDSEIEHFTFLGAYAEN